MLVLQLVPKLVSPNLLVPVTEDPIQTLNFIYKILKERLSATIPVGRWGVGERGEVDRLVQQTDRLIQEDRLQAGRLQYGS